MAKKPTKKPAKKTAKKIVKKVAKKSESKIESIDAVKARINAFCNKHKVVFTEKGECGFGRPCVGILHGDNYVDHNPHRHPNYEPIPEFKDDRLYAPEGVNSYHKHDCLAVLVSGNDYDTAIRGLDKWITYLESLGEVEIAMFETGATGFQAILTGLYGKAIRIKKEKS